MLDISTAALDRVSSFATGYLADKLHEIPKDIFDVAMSHLVAQHMTDHGLVAQIRAVTAGLKDTGVFAIQFAAHLDGLDYPEDKTLSLLKSGGRCRSTHKMREIALAANAKTIKMIDKEVYPEYKVRWHVIHLMRQ